MRFVAMRRPIGCSFEDSAIQVSDDVAIWVESYMFGCFELRLKGPTEDITYDSVDSFALSAPGAEKEAAE